MRLSLTLIARDEEAALPTLLSSIAGHVDEVVLVDTGSTDRTVALFEEWATRTPVDHVVGRFEWVDDFAAARNHAESLATGDWIAWADADDEIVGAHNLRGLTARAPATVLGFAFHYAYGPGVTFWRERIMRAGVARWVDPVHEVRDVDGELRPGAIRVPPPAVAMWVHHPRRTDAQRRERNLRLLRAWAEREPRNPTPVWYLARELADVDPDAARAHRDRYLALDPAASLESAAAALADV